jgi:glucokinase
MEHFLGIDIGGTNVKMGLVTTEGEILEHKKVPTIDLKQNGEFIKNLLNVIEEFLKGHPEIKKVGIGVPGTLDKHRNVTLEIPAISDLNGVNLKGALKERFPSLVFHLENDANAAALGEYYFAKNDVPEDYIFVTLGTGVGGAAIMSKQIFKGADGNSMEIGHIASRNNTTLEKNIGKMGMLKLANQRLSEYKGQSVLAKHSPLSSTTLLVQSAAEGDELALQVFEEVGHILGEGLVSTIRILDIKTILVGGGISAAFDFIIPGAISVLKNYLTPYYTDALRIQKATLGNNAGLVGAASLCFLEMEDVLAK